MANTATMTLNQSARNQMSIMAWVMAGLCACIMILAAYASSVPHSQSQSYAPSVSTQR